MRAPESPRRDPGRPRSVERFAPARLVVLRGLSKRGHRYRSYRALTMSLTIVILFAIPLLGIARFDLFGVEHRAFGVPATAIYALAAICAAMVAAYAATSIVNVIAGRMYCGWGCPVGELNRLTDTFVAAKDPNKKRRAGVALALFALISSAALASWWSAPEVFVRWPSAPIAVAAVAALALGSIAFARVFGWGFCRKACPIGLFYSITQVHRPIGIVHDHSRCLDELACVRACPVLLDPRDLKVRRDEVGGVAIDGLPSTNHCLRCGACVEACELATSKIVGPPALRFGRPPPALVAEPAPDKPAPGVAEAEIR